MLTEKEITDRATLAERISESAFNVAVNFIMHAVGQHAGDVAGQYFAGADSDHCESEDIEEAVKRRLRDYAHHELVMRDDADPMPVQKLADEFRRLIRMNRTLAELVEIDRRNRSAEYRNNLSCATHDYEDANMTMEQAFKNVFERDTVLEDSGAGAADLSMFNIAWDLAKARGFSGE